MSAPAGPAAGTDGRKHWITLGVLSLLAVGAGLVVPRFMDADAPSAKEAAPPLQIPAPLANKAAPEKKQPSAAGADDLAYTPPAWPDAPDARAMLVRLVVGTLLVLGLCVGTLWIGRRWLHGVPAQPGGNTQLRLVERLPLGNRCFLYLLTVQDRQLLVGVDASGMKTLVTLSEPFEAGLNDRLHGLETVPQLPGALEPHGPTSRAA
jgi:flagellar biogenesis protein FliO